MFPIIPNRFVPPITLILMLALMALLALSPPKKAWGQAEEVAMMQEVESLIDQLNSADLEQRAQAQEELTALSPDALDFIDVPDKDATTDFIKRLLTIRKALETKAVLEATRPSSVTLNGTFPLKDALAKIASQTKNQILLSRNFPPQAAQQQVKMEVDSVPFWVAIHSLMQQANLQVDTYGGGAGLITLVPRPQLDDAVAGIADAGIAEQPNQPAKGQPAGDNKPTIPQTTTGILALEINRIDASHIPGAPNLDRTALNMLIRWEPRVQPISIQLDPSKLKIIDDQDNEIKPLRQTIISAAVQSEIPELEFSLNLPRVDRRISKIKSLTGTLEAILPGRLETFRFKKIGDTEKGAKQTKSGATVTFGGVNTNEELFGVTVGLAFEGESNEVDSHQAWTFENEAYLVDPADSSQRHEAVAYETVAQDGQSTTVEYYFEVDPDKYDLMYETPAAIVSAAFDFKIQNIVLP